MVRQSSCLWSQDYLAQVRESPEEPDVAMAMPPFEVKDTPYLLKISTTFYNFSRKMVYLLQNLASQFMISFRNSFLWDGFRR